MLFAKVRGAKDLGKLFDGGFDYDRKVIFASVQTLMRQEHLGKFDLKAFDYIVFYEADLFTAINRDWLTPFYYYGIYDATVNYDNVTYLNGKYLEGELEA